MQHSIDPRKEIVFMFIPTDAQVRVQHLDTVEALVTLEEKQTLTDISFLLQDLFFSSI